MKRRNLLIHPKAKQAGSAIRAGGCGAPALSMAFEEPSTEAAGTGGAPGVVMA